MKNILDEIVTNTRAEVTEKKKKPIKSFYEAVQNPSTGDIAVIAEVKLGSPSAGILGNASDIVAIASEYESAYADALSVITDSKFFHGVIDFIPRIKSVVKLPILQKDFIIDPYQIHEARYFGADALLLIARIIPLEKLQTFTKLCLQLGIEPLIEVYDEADMKHALQTEARLIGVNARDLDTFTIDIEKACTLGIHIPKNKLFVGLSGIQSRKEVLQYKKAYAQAIVVGTNLMKATNKLEFIKNLKFS